MKKIFFATILPTIFIALTFMSCSNEPPKSELEKKSENLAEAANDLGKEIGKSGEQAGEDIKDSAHGLEKDIAEARKNLKEDINNTISNINQKIEETDKKMAKAAKSQKAAWEKEKEDLIATRERLNDNLNDVGNNVKTGWESFAMNVKRALKEVNYQLNQ